MYQAIAFMIIVNYDSRSMKKHRVTCRRGHILAQTGVYKRKDGYESCRACALILAKKHRESNPKSKIYSTWASMIARCYNPNNHAYARYGGRGIVVCDRWRNSFDDFVNDMGAKPYPDYTLDRINNDGNYEPTNCRWASKLTQANNTYRQKGMPGYGKAWRDKRDEEVLGG